MANEEDSDRGKSKIVINLIPPALWIWKRRWLQRLWRKVKK